METIIIFTRMDTSSIRFRNLNEVLRTKEITDEYILIVNWEALGKLWNFKQLYCHLQNSIIREATLPMLSVPLPWHLLNSICCLLVYNSSDLIWNCIKVCSWLTKYINDAQLRSTFLHYICWNEKGSFILRQVRMKWQMLCAKSPPSLARTFKPSFPG